MQEINVLHTEETYERIALMRKAKFRDQRTSKYRRTSSVYAQIKMETDPSANQQTQLIRASRTKTHNYHRGSTYPRQPNVPGEGAVIEGRITIPHSPTLRRGATMQTKPPLHLSLTNPKIRAARRDGIQENNPQQNLNISNNGLTSSTEILVKANNNRREGYWGDNTSNHNMKKHLGLA